MKKTALILAMLATSTLACAGSLTPAAVWGFNQNLNAQGSGPALQAIDPMKRNGFVRDTVFGQERWVYQYDGNFTPSQQAGLFVDTRGVLNADKNYSIDLVFKFDRPNENWAHILGVSNRSNDAGLYLNRQHKLQVHPLGAGSTEFDFDSYHRLTLVQAGGDLAVYLDGVKQFQWATNKLDFDTYSATNPERLLHFFTDNIGGGANGEYMDGSVAAIQLFDEALTADDVRGLTGLPEQISSAVPEPASLALALGGLAIAVGARRRRA